MARSTAVRTVDDITGELAAETVRFALDGVEYDIDLTADNAEALRTVLERYLDRGRRTGGRKLPPRRVGRRDGPRARRSVARGNDAAAEPAPVAAGSVPGQRRDAGVPRTDGRGERSDTGTEQQSAVRREAIAVPQVMFSAAP
ncbi:Lsr2 dimerization domain-containing protein [Saccharomonospora iraqiensis]|uniref:Lsr2 dimerization domain-containing protein n=1 Tax=Saccharomonospora iraqiensis TaxID=52698 RepID=UPI00022E6122|nr:histone-like nucleoid-structuring protein Lsr2 [Saccharomonospora iraqiensis]